MARQCGQLPRGGHHIPAQATIKGHPNYKALTDNAPVVKFGDLSATNSTKTGVDLHKDITRAQRQEYAALEARYQEAARIRATPDKYTAKQVEEAEGLKEITWDHIHEAEKSAHITAGFTSAQADAMVSHGISYYIGQGVSRPLKIPWGSVL